MLAIKLRNDDGIKGILKKGSVRDELKLLQYADDMTLLVKVEADLKQALTVIEQFSKISELKLNRKKSIGMWVGGSKNNEIRGEGITWVEKGKNIKVLGIYFNASEEASNIQQNWTDKLNSIKTMVQRNLSLKGKVIIAKTFLLSKLNYVLQALSLPDKALAEIDRVIFKFLWQKRYSNKRLSKK